MPVPSYVKFFLRFLASSLERSRHTECARALASSEQSPRVDAQASGLRTGIGGWLPSIGEDGLPSPKRSKWFSLEITKQSFPWVYEKGDTPSRIIASLEALAILVALRVFFPAVPGAAKAKVVLLPTWTDNRGNGSVLNKLMTTRFPLSAILMELSEQMRVHGQRAEVNWSPREANKEADHLANGDFALFDEALRIPTTAESLRWFILDDALREGRNAEAERVHDKEKKKLRSDDARVEFVARRVKRRPEDKLKFTDPWN